MNSCLFASRLQPCVKSCVVYFQSHQGRYSSVFNWPRSSCKCIFLQRSWKMRWPDLILHDHLFILPEMGHELPNYLCCWSFWSCTQYFGITGRTEALAAMTGLFHSLTCHSFTILSKVLLFFYFLWADAWINALKAFNSLARHWIQTIERQPENKNLKTIKQFPARD